MLLEAYLAQRSLARRGGKRMANGEPGTRTADAGAPIAAAVSTDADRLHRAETITKDHVLMSAVAGFVPGPGLDLAATFVIQQALLARLAKLYGVPYTENLGKNVIFSLVSSLGGLQVGGTFALSAVKFVPFVGTALGAIGVPVMMGAFTYALGKVFTRHFESGGDFLDFDPSESRRYFREMFRRGRGVTQELRAQSAATAGGPDVAQARSSGA